MTSNARRQRVAAAALLLREDRRAMLVQPGGKAEDAPWTLPQEQVADSEVAEQALARLLATRLRIVPAGVEFLDTFGVGPGSEPALVVNVFTCTDWEGDPRYSASDFRDAAWVDVANAGVLDLVPEVGAWLDRRFGTDHVPLEPAALLDALEASRVELLTAFEELPWDARSEVLDENWSPLDVLEHCGTVEAYYAAETRRLLAVDGHLWRPFNSDQEEAGWAGRSTPTEEASYPRLEAVRSETVGWVRRLTSEQLETYGNHPVRGTVQVGDQVAGIARHERAHAEQLRKMGHAARA